MLFFVFLLLSTVTPDVDESVTFEKTFNLIAFIYFGGMETFDLVEFLNAGECLEIMGLRECDVHTAEKKRKGGDPHRHKIFSKATGIPNDHPLRKTDMLRKTTTKHGQANGTQVLCSSSSTSASGSEYEAEKDSDIYSGSDDDMPLVGRQKSERKGAAKSAKMHQPRSHSNRPKRYKANPSVSKPTPSSSNQNQTEKPARAKKNVRKTVRSENTVPEEEEEQQEETFTISKADKELLERVKRQMAEAEQELESHPAEIEPEQGQNEDDGEMLDGAADAEYALQYGDDSEHAEYGIQYEDDDEMLEGAVGGYGGSQLDNNDNVLVDDGKGNDGPNDMEGAGNQQQNDVPVTRHFRGRTWTDDGIYNNIYISNFQKKINSNILKTNDFSFQILWQKQCLLRANEVDSFCFTMGILTNETILDAILLPMTTFDGHAPMRIHQYVM